MTELNTETIVNFIRTYKSRLETLCYWDVEFENSISNTTLSTRSEKIHMKTFQAVE
jgi:hypothetical protein